MRSAIAAPEALIAGEIGVPYGRFNVGMGGYGAPGSRGSHLRDYV